MRREPTRALHRVLVLAPQSFVPSDYVLVRARMQMNSCIRTFTSVRYESTIDLCFCAGGCVGELMYGRPVRLYGASPQGLYAVCFVLWSLCLYEESVWDQYACLSYANPQLKKQIQEYLTIYTAYRVQVCASTCEGVGKHVLVGHR